LRRAGEGVSLFVQKLAAGGGGRTFYDGHGRDLYGENRLAIFIIQQFGAVADGGSASLAKDHVTITFGGVDGLATVLAHPCLELTGWVFYDGDSGCHEILQGNCVPGGDGEGRLRVTNPGWRGR
jgi:hypothetical protein